MSAAFESLPPLIAAQLKYLLTHSRFPIKVYQIWSGSKNAQYSDRFTLLIPFCLDYVKWDIIYNAYYPSAAPDIVFSPEDEDFHPLPFGEDGVGEARMVKSSLCNWDCMDPTRLLALVHEIRDLYMYYQRKRVGELDDARLKFEISTVLSREGIEVCKIVGAERTEEVKFAVPLLDMDLNKLVPGCTWREQQKIYLQVVFPVSRKYSSAPTAPHIKLVSSSDLQTLFSIEDVKLPPWLDGMCMAEYLPNLEEKLREQIVEAVKAVDDRRRFIEALAVQFGRPVEADPVFCRSATVLSVSGTFIFLVHFSIPTQFPRQKPILMLESSLHFDFQGRPIKLPQMMEYPWSPRWEISHMVERIFEFLVDECLNFKKYCGDVVARQQ
uniref:BRISC and BRCA1-A complex member 2 n=1 Tax=Anthurium amnicola TaxID=1678845 RepID=A0A1D1YQF3_9ARAE